MNNPPLISICIPTYNRKDKLERAINNVIGNIKGHKLRYELVISDNASTDGTGDLVKKNVKKYSFIKYSRNNVNKGIDHNVIQCVNNADGKYVMFLSDTDLIVKGALKRISAVLLKHDVSCAFLNNFGYDMITKKREPNFKRVNKNLFFNDHNEFMNFLGFHSCWISGIIVRKDTIRIKDVEKYFGLHFTHWCFLLNAAADNNAVFISSPSTISVDDHRKIGFDMLECAINMEIILADYFKSGIYDKRKVKSLRFGIFKKIFECVVVYKANRNPALKNRMRSLRRIYGAHLPFWLILVLIYILPGFIFVFVKKLKNRVF